MFLVSNYTTFLDRWWIFSGVVYLYELNYRLNGKIAVKRESIPDYLKREKKNTGIKAIP